MFDDSSELKEMNAFVLFILVRRRVSILIEFELNHELNYFFYLLLGLLLLYEKNEFENNRRKKQKEREREKERATVMV